MALNPVKRLWTVEEYLADKETADVSARHSIIGLNLGAELRQALRKSNLQVYPSDICIKVSKAKYLYPDLSVALVNALFSEKHHPMINNPIVVNEVLSPSTANYDKGQKYDYYRSLPSVQAYLMLEQDRAHAMLYTRDKTGWHLEEYSGLEAIVPLEAIGCELKLNEAYLNLEIEVGKE